ncbi:hypothetical protein [Streptomyces sp. NPDC004376]
MSDTTTQGSHHYLVTLQIPLGTGFAVSTWEGTWTPPEGYTRHDFYKAVRDDIAQKDPQLTSASVLFFDVQPNQL